jgi:hypothetical protein
MRIRGGIHATRAILSGLGLGCLPVNTCWLLPRPTVNILLEVLGETSFEECRAFVALLLNQAFSIITPSRHFSTGFPDHLGFVGAYKFDFTYA